MDRDKLKKSLSILIFIQITFNLEIESANFSSQNDFFVFRRITNFIGASLIAHGYGNFYDASLKIRGNGDIEEKVSASFINIDNFFGKREFAIFAARIKNRADFCAGRACFNNRRNRIFAARTI